jgi:hypothetical protein
MLYSVQTPNGVVIVKELSESAAALLAAIEAQCAPCDCAVKPLGGLEYGVVVSYVTSPPSSVPVSKGAPPHLFYR